MNKTPARLSLVVDRRTRTLHRASCAKARRVPARSRVKFQSVREAKSGGAARPCALCLPRDVYRYIAALEETCAGIVSLAGMPEYFPSEIYHNSFAERSASTYSVLSYRKGFGMPEAEILARARGMRTIFILCAGQQGIFSDQGKPRFDILTLKTGPEADEGFSRPLTGCQRDLARGDKDSADITYRVHTSKSHASVASRLFDAYGDRALVVDVLNTNFNWESAAAVNEQILEKFFSEVVRPLAVAAEGAAFFVAGFSRGGVFALRTAEKIRQTYGPAAVACCVTVDPVINPIKEKEMIVEYYVRDRRGDPWKPSRRAGVRSPENCFTVVRGIEGVHTFNVFQRASLLRNLLIETLTVPIGTAVLGAKSPIEAQWPGLPHPEEFVRTALLNQYDAGEVRHTPDMIRKYAAWIEWLAERFFVPPRTNKV